MLPFHADIFRPHFPPLDVAGEDLGELGLGCDRIGGHDAGAAELDPHGGGLVSRENPDVSHRFPPP